MNPLHHRLHGQGLQPPDDHYDRVSIKSTVSQSSVSSSLFSCVRSCSTLIEEEGYVPRTKICLIGDVGTTAEAAAEHFGMPVVKSKTGLEYLDDPSVLLVVDDFTPQSLEKIGNIKWRVVGSVALIECANADIPLPIERRPIFCFSMRGVVTCFTGIRDRELALELMALIRAMGGSVRKEPHSSVTHIISVTTKGKKYHYATVFNVPIMSPDWVRKCWDYRFDHSVEATDDELMLYRLKPFVDVSAAFISFPQHELDQMIEQLISQGGTYVEATDPNCTHIVADDASPVTIPSGANPAALVVRAEWFWVSIQRVMHVAEDGYLVADDCFRHPPQRRSVRRRPTGPMLHALQGNNESVDPMDASGKSPGTSWNTASPSPFVLKTRRFSLAELSTAKRSPLTPMQERTLTASPASPTTPLLFSEKTLTFDTESPEDAAPSATSLLGRRASTNSLPASPAPPARRARLSGTPPLGSPHCRRRSSPRVAATPSGHPATASSHRRPLSGGPQTSPSSPCTSGCTPRGTAATRAAASPRRISLSRRCLDSAASTPISPRFGAFLELMHTEENYVGILDAILQMRDDALDETQDCGRLLSPTEAKMIFGSIVPIARTHHDILKDLRLLYNNWTETAEVGQIFVKYSPDLIRDYAPFVSSFEDAKEAVEQTSRKNPRFNAFLKVCRNKPECGRQELHELMIRPVQRLASCVLLLREILKHTPQECPDRPQLESALESLSHVLSFINEDKRKMESLCKVFDVYNLIDKCPADLIASHRVLIVECEGVEVSENGFGKQGNVTAFFVFTDVILVCKKKSKVVSMLKGSPYSGTKLPRRVLKAVDGKPYKFLQMLPLSTVRKIIDITDSPGISNAMGVVFRGRAQIRESCAYFRLLDAGPGVLDKVQVLERWSVALASHNCVADPSRFVQRETVQEAGISTCSGSEALSRRLSKAAQMAVKTQVIVASAFGIGRTQSHASKSPQVSSPPCALTTFNSTSRLETMRDALEEDDDEEVERPKPSSLTANIMKRM